MYMSQKKFIMAEQRKMSEIYVSIYKKDVQSFQTVYNSLHRPIKKYTLSKIVTDTIRQGFADGLQMLVNENGVGCLTSEGQENSFHVACKSGHVKVVKLLLGLKEYEKGVTAINFREQDGLSIAIENENEELCSTLLGSGLFHIDKIPCSRFSRLFDALTYKNKKVAHFLITHGADVTLVGHNECLEEISCVCLSAIKVPSLLVDILKNGGDPNDVHAITGKSVLQLALEAQADRKTVEAVVRSGADLNLKDNFGKNPLCSVTSLDQLYGFIDVGVSVEEIEQKYKFSTLKIVLKSRHNPEDVKFFLEKGANVRYFKDGEESLLIKAVQSMFVKEGDVRILVEYGADPNKRNNEGLTALQLIFKNRKILYKDALYLLELGVNADGCLLNVLEKFPNVEKETYLVKQLLGCGADANEESRNNKSILSTAIERNLFEIADELIKHGADVNFIDSKGVSPLGYAIQLCTKDKNMRFLRMLLNCPVKIRECNFTDEVNNMAIRSTEISTIAQKQLIFDAMGVFLLLVAGADVIIPSRCSDLSCFLRYGLYETASQIMQSGLNIDWRPNVMIENIDSEMPNFEIYNVSYSAIVSEEKKKNLLSIVNKIEREPKSLQHLCRSQIRRELAVRGHSILPLIEDLPIPKKMKSFMKFEDIQLPTEESVSVYVIERYSPRYDDDRFDDYDYDDYYHNDHYDNDYEEQFFNTETDEFEPIWW